MNPIHAISFESLCSKEVEELRHNPSHVLPIYATSSFVFESLDQSQSVFTKQEPGYLYSRYANPTIESVAKKIAAMESYDLDEEYHCLLTNSGMSAITLVLSSTLQSGDKILTQSNLYGGTTELLKKVFQRFNIEPVFTDLSNIDAVRRSLDEHPEIAMLYGETPANPSLACIDLTAIAQLCKLNNVLTVIDNTFCTPYLQRPLSVGIDVVIHSTTKALNGHGNAIGGAIVFRKTEYDTYWNTYKLMGLNPSPFDTWLLHNGLKTLIIRMDKACKNAQAIAEHLEQHVSVAKVNYPGLPSHSSFVLAKSQMSQFGTMLSFELQGGIEAGKRFMDNVNLVTHAPTLGDLDTLILHPASSSHLNINREVRIANGITDGLIRMSVGIEKIEDLLEDINKAISNI